MSYFSKSINWSKYDWEKAKVSDLLDGLNSDYRKIAEHGISYKGDGEQVKALISLSTFLAEAAKQPEDNKAVVAEAKVEVNDVADAEPKDVAQDDVAKDDDADDNFDFLATINQAKLKPEHLAPLLTKHPHALTAFLSAKPDEKQLRDVVFYDRHLRSKLSELIFKAGIKVSKHIENPEEVELDLTSAEKAAWDLFKDGVITSDVIKYRFEWGITREVLKRALTAAFSEVSKEKHPLLESALSDYRKWVKSHSWLHLHSMIWNWLKWLVGVGQCYDATYEADLDVESMEYRMARLEATTADINYVNDTTVFLQAALADKSQDYEDKLTEAIATLKGSLTDEFTRAAQSMGTPNSRTNGRALDAIAANRMASDQLNASYVRLEARVAELTEQLENELARVRGDFTMSLKAAAEDVNAAAGVEQAKGEILRHINNLRSQVATLGERMTETNSRLGADESRFNNFLRRLGSVEDAVKITRVGRDQTITEAARRVTQEVRRDIGLTPTYGSPVGLQMRTTADGELRVMHTPPRPCREETENNALQGVMDTPPAATH